MRYPLLTGLLVLTALGAAACSGAGTDPLNPIDNVDAGAVADSAGRVATAVIDVQIDTVAFLEPDPEDLLEPCTNFVIDPDDAVVTVNYVNCPKQDGTLNGRVILTPQPASEGGGFAVEYDLVQRVPDDEGGFDNIDITGTTRLTLTEDADGAIHDGRIKGEDDLTEITLDANEMTFPLASAIDGDTEPWPTGFYSGVARVLNLPIFNATLTFDGSSTVQVLIAGFDFDLDLETGEVSR